MRKALLILGLLAALAVPAAASAMAPPPPVICGTACDGGGGGWTGCSQQTATDSTGIRFLSWYRHYLVVSYCKVNGIVTSANIVAHGCDYEGAMACFTGPAWISSGGIGAGWVHFTGHATYVGALAGVPIAGSSTVNFDVPIG